MTRFQKSAQDHGPMLLGVLCGHRRYAHINGVRGDGVDPGLLGIAGTVSEDAVRLAMGRIDEEAGLDCISNQILGVEVRPAKNMPPPKACPVAGKPWKNFPAINGPPSSGETAATAASPPGNSSSCLMANLIALFHNWWHLYLRLNRQPLFRPPKAGALSNATALGQFHRVKCLRNELGSGKNPNSS